MKARGKREAPKARNMIARGKREAPKARNIIARGKREAQRNASPLVTKIYFEQSTESAKYRRQLFRSFRARRSLRTFTRATRLTLFDASPWLSYCAPLALSAAFWLNSTLLF
jgi:hypothetical protein